MSNIKIGISSCLLGNKVRFDSGHKKNAYVNNVLNKHFEFVAFCPEVAIGLTIPRKPIRLIQRKDIIDVVEPNSGDSYLEKLQNYANTIHTGELDGFIFKKDSPSCGVYRVKTYHENGNKLNNNGVGGFSEQFIKNFPNIPIEEEGRLNDNNLRDNFIQRIFLYNEVKTIYCIYDLIEFQRRHKFIFYSYNQTLSKELGRIVARYRSNDSFLDLKESYVSLLMKGTIKPAKKSNQINAMLHILGFLKTRISKEEKKDILRLIERYREGTVDILEPLTILKYLVRHNGNEYIKEQEYIKKEYTLF